MICPGEKQMEADYSIKYCYHVEQIFTIKYRVRYGSKEAFCVVRVLIAQRGVGHRGKREGIVASLGLAVKEDLLNTRSEDVDIIGLLIYVHEAQSQKDQTFNRNHRVFGINDASENIHLSAS